MSIWLPESGEKLNPKNLMPTSLKKSINFFLLSIVQNRTKLKNLDHHWKPSAITNKKIAKSIIITTSPLRSLFRLLKACTSDGRSNRSFESRFIHNAPLWEINENSFFGSLAFFSPSSLMPKLQTHDSSLRLHRARFHLMKHFAQTNSSLLSTKRSTKQ